MFGRGLVEVWSAGHEVFGLTRAKADLTRAEEVRAAFQKIRPEVVVHPAGIPDLDVCESDPAQAFLVNVHGARHVVEAARELGAAVAFISTDAVFDGRKTAPYVESDATIPPTVYGRTKLLGERAVAATPRHWIFRVSVLFGPGKTNFVEKGLRRLAAGEDCVAASDQLGSATSTLDAGRKMLEVVEAKRYGLYHLSNQGACTRFELMRRAAELAGLDVKRIVGKPWAEMGRRAARLSYAVMEMNALKRAGFLPPRPWEDALADYVATLVPALRSAARAQARP